MVYLRSNEPPHVAYGAASLSHTEASSSALTELAAISSATPKKGDRPIHVRISHIEHGAFLTLALYGFPVLIATGELVEIPSIPGEDPVPPAMRVVAPQKCDEANPFLHAVVVNHPVEIQIKNCIAMLAMLLDRQELVDSIDGNSFSQLEGFAAKVDSKALTEVEDLLRSVGWREAASRIKARSSSSGRPLVVTYTTVFMDREQIALRTPILRRVYNRFPAVRAAVDNVATLLSQGMHVTGEGPEAITAFARDSLDVGSNKTFLAHFARDTMVCGNGYLSFGAMPDEDTRLLRPENVTIIRDNIVRLEEGGRTEIHRGVLRAQGAEQLEGEYGVSPLEPFVQHLMEHEGYDYMLRLEKAAREQGASEEVRSSLADGARAAASAMKRIEDRIDVLLGAPSRLGVKVPPELYFEGCEQMLPEAGGVATGGRES
ncbi:hypothetical protein SK803_43630 [Lentzea sp. BCCO 10_0856]|uniref:Uncharacterized protein n=1 Tax=Lentzea miocenica TaxID=3095431 RepID=A0ABU4TG25_9PSEU|nr:hypothetical protein [Lentzea sp. BCCO 10_0856]MDX8037126.1 hypothetical protein [Lentzea sp. BCCO 10_0856]